MQSKATAECWSPQLTCDQDRIIQYHSSKDDKLIPAMTIFSVFGTSTKRVVILTKELYNLADIYMNRKIKVYVELTQIRTPRLRRISRRH